MTAYITVGEDYEVEWEVRREIAEKGGDWYFFKRWDPVEIEFTLQDLLKEYDEVWEYWRGETDGLISSRKCDKEY